MRTLARPRNGGSGIGAQERWIGDEPIYTDWRLPFYPKTGFLAFAASRPHAHVRVEQEFSQLADQWERDTLVLSMVTSVATHPAYQRIIGLGPAAVPLILERLQRSPRQWFWALTAITGEDPAAGEETAAGAARAWLDWGRRRGLVE